MFEMIKAQQSIITLSFDIVDLQGPRFFFNSFMDFLLSSLHPPSNLPTHLSILRLALADQWHSVGLGF